MRSPPAILVNLTKTTSASALQFIITLIATPLMARLYAPSAYAIFGMSNQAASVLVGIGLLSLPSAFVGEKNSEYRQALMRVMLLLLAVLCALSLLGLVGWSLCTSIHEAMPLPLSAALILPVLVATYGLRAILMNVAVERGNFTRVSLVRVTEPLCSRGGSIVLGAWLGGHPTLILFSVVAGQWLAIRMLMKHISFRLRTQWREIFMPFLQLKSVLRRYTDFIIFNTASHQIPSLVMLFYQFLIGLFYSGDATGQFILANSILMLPCSLIALSASPVAHHHFKQIRQEAPHKLFRHLGLLTLLFGLCAFVIYMPVYFYGPLLFRVAFGAPWEHAGEIASILSLAHIGSFVTISIQSIVSATRRMKLQFLCDALITLPTLLIMAYSFGNVTLEKALLLLSILWCARHVVVLGVCLFSALTHAQETGVTEHEPRLP